MGKPIEDIRGPVKSDAESPTGAQSFFSSEAQQPASTFTNPSIRSFEENQKTEINAIDSEISTNPFLMRYANHTAVPENLGTLKRRSSGSSGGGSRRPLWVFAGIVFFVALVSLSYAFAKTTVLVTPKTSTVSLNDTFTAQYQSESSFSFERMSVENTETASVTSSGSTASDLPATGKVMLYNEYSTSPQNLLINTRLEAPDGKIYMTDTAVSIPGYKKTGTEITPGSIEVGIHAEKGGASYNREETDFVIFGWKNDKAKKDKFYARSTTPISGGSSGLVYTITEEEYTAKIAELETALRQKITNQINAEVPEGFFTTENSIFIEEVERSLARSSVDVTVPVSVTMKGTAYIFSNEEFANEVKAKNTEAMLEFADTQFTLKDSTGAVFSIPSDTINDTAVSVSLTVSGDITLVALYDKNELLTDLLGQKTKNIGDILQKNSAIESIKVKMRPPWKQSFPDSPEDIEIISADKVYGVDL